jgi:hypothetical protein
VRFLAILGLLCVLGGCQDSGLVLAAKGGKRIVVGPSVPVALESMEGAPEAIAPRFSAALASEAQAREIVFVDSANAPRFKLRGYLSAAPGAQGGTMVSWVWDVFDQRLKRAQRASGAESVARSDAANPWNVVDDALLKRVAARSLDEIASFLVGASTADTPMAGAAPAARDARAASAD